MQVARVADGWLVTSDGRISHFKENEFYVGANFLERMSLPKVQEGLVDKLENVRFVIAEPLYISSGVRSAKSNASAGGASNSLHLRGAAVDFHAVGKTPLDFVRVLEDVTQHGTVGRYGLYHRTEGGHVHLDEDRNSPLRRFVKLGGQYVDLIQWMAANFPGVLLPIDVPRDKANALLGF